jgi:hypothetical protein
MQDQDLHIIRGLREQVEGHLRQQLGSAPRIYYGGSYGKGTMIREAFDLDLVVYYPDTETATLSQIFNAAHRGLTNTGYIVEPKTVALRLPYTSEFHVDVVPGRAQDATFRYATLFQNKTPASTLQTSLKVHIDGVKSTGLAPIVRLLKLWRRRHNVPLPTFALEILAARGLAGQRRDNYARALNTVWAYMEQCLSTVRLEDPANTKNVVELGALDRLTAAAQAGSALRATYWERVIW